jgi:hypothetical protein
MTAGELLGTVVIGVLVAVALGVMVWQDYCRERDHAARRSRQQQPRPPPDRDDPG